MSAPGEGSGEDSRADFVDEEPLEEVAVVGMAGRFPGAPDLEAFWRNLRAGVESISFFGDEELLAAGVDPALLRNPRYVRARGVIADADRFDAGLFGFSPREATITDPQHRVFLECAWEALERAGFDPEAFGGRIGVYAGCIFSTYLMFHLFQHATGEDEKSWQMVLANDKDTLSTRASYKLGLSGPSVTVQTACSTSLVAVHMARQSLLDYECDLALAGGVSIRSPQTVGYLYQEEGIQSPDGHCRAFDSHARGTVFGAGAGLVVLRRLSDALADGDTIRAVLKGSAINNDGAAKIGYTAPSMDGQAQVVTRALALASAEPESIGYIEAHGTGTALGDPIEIAALTRAFRAGTSRRGFCAVGSVKTNVGHLDAAAGIAGLIKTVLALEHREIPPSLHYERPNPQIDFEASPFFVADRLRPWESAGPRRAGVSSFGIGGTNAHVVVEEAPAPDAGPRPSRPSQLLVLSAKTETALAAVAERLAGHLSGHSGERELTAEGFADLAFTLKVGRRALPWRRAVVAASPAGALAALTASSGACRVGDGSPAVAFLFPGQGSQRVGMGRQLYDAEPVFRRELDRAAEILRPHLGEDLLPLLFPSEARREEAARRLERTALTQPALFAVEAALARLWMSWGVKPQAMLGHSVGEYVAAHLAGVLSLEDALALVAARGRLIDQLPGGAMLAVPLPESEALPLLGGDLSLAAVNGPLQCVVSGPEGEIEALRAELAARGIEGRRLATSHAFHSRQMEALLAPFTQLVRRVALEVPQIPFVSNVTGRFIAPEEAVDPAYWAEHLRRTVRFADGLATLLADPDRALLEVGPGRALTRLARRQWEREGQGERLALASLGVGEEAGEEGRSEPAAVLSALGRLWAAGAPVDWAGFHAGERRRRVPLPAYPFERQRFWVEPARRGGGAGEAADADPSAWFHLPSWRRSLPLPPLSGSLAGSTPYGPDGPVLAGESASLPPSWPAAGGETTAAPAGDPGDAGSWLVLLDRCGLGEALAARLERSGRDVVRVHAGEDCVGEVDPRRPETYAALLARLRAEGRSPRVVLHLWSLTPAGEPPIDFEEAQALGFASLCAWSEALEGDGARDSVVLAVTNGVERVTSEEDLCPAKAPLLGWARASAGQGRERSRRRVVDVTLHPAGSPRWEQLAERLLAEAGATAPEPVVAYRGGDRWVPALEPAPLPAPERPAAWLRPRGVYLLTGGLGGLSFAMALRLAETAPVRLALVGPADEAVEGDDSRLAALRALGAEAMWLEADPADPGKVRQALARVEAAWGPLDGIFYLPGQRGAEHWMRGALALDAVLGAGRPRDFLVLFSWLEPAMALRARPDLWAASALLDALARDRSARGAGRTVAIDWGPGVGFDAPEAFAALDRILAGPAVAQVAVVGPRASGERQEEPAGAAPTEQVEHAEDVPTGDPIAERIAVSFREVLGVRRVGLKDRFFDLGGDSLVALQVMARLRETFDLDLPVRALLEKPTVAELRDVVEEALIAKLEALPEEEAERLAGGFLA